MESPIDALIVILDQEAALYTRMADVLGEEKAATIASNVADLHIVGSKKEKMISAISRLERHRLRLAHAINREWFNAQGPVAFSDLVQHLDPQAAHRLTQRRETLLTTLGRVKALNAENASLLSHSISWVGGAMRLLNHLFNPQTVYQRSGRFAKGGHTGRVLNGTY
jgi:flagellar biosynthesis/type III secretory pathway chaperone